MCIISAKEFFLWKKKQISKGGDNKNLSLLIDTLGGLSDKDINLIKIRSEKNVTLNKNLDSLESIWENHILTSTPIQYLSGISFWRDLRLKVSNKVLIPRSETEIIIEIVSNLFPKKEKGILFADLGTGSGAISIALALAHPKWEGLATDIDKQVLKIALENFTNYSYRSNLKFYCGSWWDPLKIFEGELDLVIANPPYIPIEVYKNLPKEVKDFEPKIALLGGEDGLVHIKEIIKYAPLYLKEKGWLLIENHFDQGTRVKQLFLDNGFIAVEVLKDFAGIGRFTIGRYK